MKHMVDPPEGWKYGFPKEYPQGCGRAFELWIVDEGYPQSLVDAGMLEHCRHWQEPSKT